MAFGACLLDREKSLLHSYLAVAVAGRARSRRSARLGAAAMADSANFHCGNADFGFSSACRLFQRDFQVIAQIRTAINVGMSAACTEYIAKYIAKCVSKSLGTRTGHAGIHTGMTVLVVCRTFLRIGKYFVGFFGFLEMVFRFWIIRVAVRMMLHRQLAVGFLDFVFAGVAVNAQHFIVVAFAHINFLDKWESRRFISTHHYSAFIQ